MICSRCVKPEKLKKFIDGRGLLGCCQYCKSMGTAVTTTTLFSHIMDLVDRNIATEEDLTEYERGLIYHCGSDFVAPEEIDIVLSEWFDLGDEPYFGDLIAHVPEAYRKNVHGNERHFYSDNGELELNIYEDKWDAFIAGIRHTHRFFNPNAKVFLDSVFSLLKVNNSGELKQGVVRILGRGQLLYRARTVQNVDAATKIESSPHTELGPTPKDKASSQRMTPSGISALYCALERETCLSEIRAITGDVVVSGAMTPITQLRLLDLTKLRLVEPEKLTVFDDGYRDSLHLRTFLKSLIKKMSKPKSRNDELSYLSTQVVFEYLRLQFGSQVDGLVFPSVQTGEAGTNVVLFPEACVISSERFYPSCEHEQDLEQVKLDPFAVRKKLVFVANSLRYHEVKAIETKAVEYDNSYYPFMSDLIRKRLGLV